MTRTKKRDRTQKIISRTENCDKYFEEFPILGVQDVFVKQEKKQMRDVKPLAFSHLVHKEIAIYEAFLSLYFRPDNFDMLSPKNLRSRPSD